MNRPKSDAMLGELYKRIFKAKAEAERLNAPDSDDRLRQVAIAESRLLSELIAIRTDQIRGTA